MEQLPQDIRLLRRAYWLTRLRWIAIAGLCLTAFFAERILPIDLQMVAVCEESDYVRVSNKDTGIGIPKKELPLVFDEFYRASNARQIVERHNGKLWAESELGEGTVLTYTLLRS